jgi:hypothetical protein
MPHKTRKHSRRTRRKTLRRHKKKRGGSRDSQELIIPTSAFKGSDMINSDNQMGGIAKL